MSNTPADERTIPYRIANPEQFTENLLKIYELGGQVMAELLDREDGKPSAYSTASEARSAAATLSELAMTWIKDPAKLAEVQTELLQGYLTIWNNALRRYIGEQVEPVIEPEPSDSRFKDPEWKDNPFFDFWKQVYLLTANRAEKLLEQTEGLDEPTRQRAEFHLRQLTSALSPSNNPLLNPEVVRETLKTNAENLVQGLALLNEDMRKSGDLLKISQTDVSSFEVGKNLATTPGKVVYQNDIFQLIQYSPSTDKVRERPLMMVPPWINKFYILDLTPQKSLIKYIVDQGFTVFIVSWVNPDDHLANKTFEDYVFEGLLTAADVVKRETGVEQCNILGYCVGGTLVGTSLAYLAQRGEEPFYSATLLTTQVDFSKAGDLLLFTNDDQLMALEELMSQRGFLDGSRMANVFNMMRPKDLIWPYIVNNYLLGKKPFPFDLLYWNQDSTRMPAANHAFYLREFYNENRLAKGQMVIGGTRLDLKKITLPIFEVATREDHIAPAVSVFRGMQMVSSPVEFVLAGSGHIAGVINPPEKVKYQYWTSKSPHAESLEAWLKTAEETPGSWWPYWMDWLHGKSGGWVLPRTPGQRVGVIEDAPGSYVKEKS